MERRLPFYPSLPAIWFLVVCAAVLVTYLHRTGIPWVLWVTLAVLALLRLLTIAYFFRRKGFKAFTLLTSELYSVRTDDQRRKLHEGIAREVERLSDTALIVGALALAAWAALFVVDEQAPVSELTPAGRSLLLVGAAVLIGTPTFFRVPDRHLSALGRQAGLYLGLTTVGLAFASLASDLLHGWPSVCLASAGAVALAIREVWDSVETFREICQL